MRHIRIEQETILIDVYICAAVGILILFQRLVLESVLVFVQHAAIIIYRQGFLLSCSK